jgi:hypothetical protein
MKISGFTIIRNAIINDYPAVEAITSILPVVDEMVVAVGESDDDTLALIQSIQSDKIRIVETKWDLTKLPGGRVMAIETDKAFRCIAPDSDWGFYIQCDEVVHEQYHAAIREACAQHLNDKRVLGLVFGYFHFYGTYDYVGDSRRWYNREIRIIKNDKRIHSFKDAQGFRIGEKDRLPCKLIDAMVYHYGWVKSPELMDRKLRTLSKNWMGKSMKEALDARQTLFNYDDFDSLAKYEGTHPLVMQQRIADKNWQVEIDISKKRFSIKKRVMYWLEKMTGKRFFAFRNYRIV